MKSTTTFSEQTKENVIPTNNSAKSYSPENQGKTKNQKGKTAGGKHAAKWTSKGSSAFLIEEERKFLLNKKSGFFSREAYNMLRTNLSFALAETENCKVVMITSPMQGEGKSITAANLAISLAEAGHRVLLLDCDLRRPKLGRLLSLQSQAGLSDILLQPKLLRENTLNYREGIHVILAGSIPPNPSELLNSVRMESLIKTLRERYDYIILDTPPITVVTDAAVLAAHADGVLIVVRTGQSERGPVTQTVEQLEYCNARILGFVMTCVPLEDTNYAYGKTRYKKYSRYGKYGYGKYGYGKYGYGYGRYGYGYGSDNRQEDREQWQNAVRNGDADPDD